jgi:hypothetical protein
VPLEQRHTAGSVAEEHPQAGEVEERRRPEGAHGSRIAAPLPFLWVRAQSRSDGVENDVTRELERVRLVVDHLVEVAAFKERAFPAVLQVEPHRIAALQILHAGGQVGVRRLDCQMEVIAHQAIRMAPPAIAPNGALEQLEEVLPVTPDDVEDLALLDAA